MFSRDYILAHVLPKVMGTDDNLQTVQEAGIPYELICGTDLMAIYYIPVAQTDGIVQITEQIRALTDVSAHELSYAAKKNVLRQMIIRPMAEIMADMMGADYIPELDDDSDSISLTVVTTTSGTFGAGVLACKDAYMRMSRYLGTDSIYILPSSLHDSIIIGDGAYYSYRDSGLL